MGGRVQQQQHSGPGGGSTPAAGSRSLLLQPALTIPPFPPLPWPAVFAATDILLLSLGVNGSEPVNGDIQWQFDTFLKAWKQGGLGGRPVLLQAGRNTRGGRHVCLCQTAPSQ